MGIVILPLLVLGAAYSTRLRMERRRVESPLKPKNSPASLALQELIATAGGIYLSLIMLVSFLKLAVPEKLWVGSVEMDPLALGSICLGIVQPIVLKFIKR